MVVKLARLLRQESAFAKRLLPRVSRNSLQVTKIVFIFLANLHIKHKTILCI